jgi:hypothetical protein
MIKRICISLLGMLLIMSLVASVLPIPVKAAPSTSVTITRYASDNTTILDQATIDYQSMKNQFPVQGDDTTHQYLQGPVFEGDIWDPGETVNIKDWGANKGTDLKDLCELAGGMSPSDTVEVKASDGLARIYDYPNVYNPDPRQGKMVICWWYNGQYVPDWSDGMRLVFFAETTNPDGLYVFGNWDQHECFAPDRWYFYNGEYPTTTGHSIKYVNQINIYTDEEVEYNLTIAIDGEGSTSPSAGIHTYSAGTVINLKATPDDGWEFTGWDGDVADEDSATTTVTMDEGKHITANFGQDEYQLNIKVEGEGTTSPTPGKHYYTSGTDINIRASPEEGWYFLNWEGEVTDEDSERTVVTVDKNKTVTAHFAKVVFELTIDISGQGSTVPKVGKHRYSQDAVVNLKAVPDDGWLFAGWTGNVADAASRDTTITKDKQVTALFKEATGQVAAVLPSPSEAVDQKLPLPATKSGTINWVLVLGIVWGEVVLAGVVLLIPRLKRH